MEHTQCRELGRTPSTNHSYSLSKSSSGSRAPSEFERMVQKMFEMLASKTLRVNQRWGRLHKGLLSQRLLVQTQFESYTRRSLTQRKDLECMKRKKKELLGLYRAQQFEITKLAEIKEQLRTNKQLIEHSYCLLDKSPCCLGNRESPRSVVKSLKTERKTLRAALTVKQQTTAAKTLQRDQLRRTFTQHSQEQLALTHSYNSRYSLISSAQTEFRGLESQLDRKLATLHCALQHTDSHTHELQLRLTAN